MGLGSGIRKKPIPNPGSRGQKGTGSRIHGSQNVHTTLMATMIRAMAATNKYRSMPACRLGVSVSSSSFFTYNKSYPKNHSLRSSVTDPDPSDP
jgi:hypothetical protein